MQAATGLMLVLERSIQKFMTKLTAACGLKAQVAVDLDGDGQVDFVQPPSAWVYYTKGTLFWVLALALLQAISVGVFLVTVPEMTWQAFTLHQCPPQPPQPSDRSRPCHHATIAPCPLRAMSA